MASPASTSLPAAEAALATPVEDGVDCASHPVEDMIVQAAAASALLKALAHEGRLMILCFLTSGEKSVTELENLLGSRQAAVSQQLARLRLEGLVTCRREGKAIYYALGDDRAARTVALMYEMFCGQPVETLKVAV